MFTMKASTALVFATAVLRALAAPLDAHPIVKKDVVTVTEDTVVVVTHTAIVWVPADYQPSEAVAEPTPPVEVVTTSELPEPTTSAYVPPTTSSTSTSSTSTSSTPTSTYSPPPITTTSSSSSSSTYVAPSTTSSAYVAPVQSVEAVVSSVVQAPAAVASTTSQSTNESSGSDGGAASGQFTSSATYYAPGMGSCGTSNGDGDMIVALAKNIMSEWTGNPNLNPNCGRGIRVTNTETGKSLDVKVMDTCPGCNDNGLDMTTSVFTGLGADISEGHFPISWDWLN